ncbi:MAG: CDP-alcohol phosphatidyltransferase family protein [Pseudomonadales bacterium]|nr:CDP-alcohol phosphatidyltransferase family protein [Pseudomonadales bacterium]MDG1441355.1 CDP-alcohol phosphatidyltransferase family protein [Pseudomonadales bacterium]
MLDSRLRPIIDPYLTMIARQIVRLGWQANTLTVSGFVIGMLSVPLIALHFYELAAVCVVLNRLFDGLDGTVARSSEPTEVGGYLDIVLDFIFYSAVVFSFALAQPENAVYAAFLIFAFIGTGTTFLAFAIFAEKHSLTTSAQGSKSIYYLSGIIEGTETFLTLIAMCLMPNYFWIIALCIGSLCWVSALSRLVQSINILKGYSRKHIKEHHPRKDAE